MEYDLKDVIKFIINLDNNDFSKAYAKIRAQYKLRTRVNEVNLKKFVKVGDGTFHNGAEGMIYPMPHIDTPFKTRVVFLKALLLQKWEYLFDGFSLDEEKKYYVYAHVDPRELCAELSSKVNIIGTPFYIGKGTGQRAYDLSRNQGHGKKIKILLEKEYTKNTIVNIVEDNLSELNAYVLEAKLIYFFGTIYEKNRKNGVLYNLDTSKRPNFQKDSGKYRLKPKKRGVYVESVDKWMSAEHAEKYYGVISTDAEEKE